MGRKIRTSEYQRSFQRPSKEYSKTVHEELCAYRYERRQLESAHERLRWESSDTGSSDNSGTNSPSPVAEAPHQDGKEEAPNTGIQRKDNEQTITPTSMSEDTDETKVTDTKEEPKIQNFGKKKTNQNVTELAPTEEKPPFVTYGWADKELNTARKLTHNVKANNEYVYPAALKKLKLLKSKRKRQDDIRAESRASVAAALQNKQKTLVGDIWMTEYQRCFSRNPAARPASTASNPPSHRRRPQKTKRPKTR